MNLIVLTAVGLVLSGGDGGMQDASAKNAEKIVYHQSNMRSAMTVTLWAEGKMTVAIDGRSESSAQEAKISAQEYAPLKALVTSKEFAALKQAYTNPTVDDGFSLSITANGKNVLVENQKVPPVLQKVIDAIEALRVKHLPK